MIVMTPARIKYEAAQKKYSRAFNRAYAMSERGEDVKAHKILKRINEEWAAAKAEYAAATS